MRQGSSPTNGFHLSSWGRNEKVSLFLTNKHGESNCRRKKEVFTMKDHKQREMEWGLCMRMIQGLMISSIFPCLIGTKFISLPIYVWLSPSLSPSIFPFLIFIKTNKLAVKFGTSPENVHIYLYPSKHLSNLDKYWSKEFVESV